MLAIFLLSLFGLILINVPISISLIATAVIMMLFNGDLSPQVLSQGLFRGIDNFPLLAIPFFMLAGEIMNAGGISRRIVKFADSLIGHISGGVGYVGVVTSMIFAGVSGSAIADTSAVGSVLSPIMKENGYNVPKSTALICASGCIGPIIPPSIPLILYGVNSGVSVVKLFLGGIVPGVLIGLFIMVVWYFHSKKNNYPSRKRTSLKQVIKSTIEAFWAILMPVIIMGGILSGIATPTESAVVAVVYAFIISMFVYKELKFSEIPKILIEGCKSTASIMFVVGGATAAAYMITVAHIPELLTNAILSLTTNIYAVLLLLNILLLVVGCVLDLGAAVLILTPILVPMITELGLDPVYFGVVMIVNLCIGLLTPPVGSVLYVGCSISKISVLNLFKGLVPFLAVMVFVLFIITYIPGIVLFIPNL